MEESGSYYPSEDLDYSGELFMVDEYLRLYTQGIGMEEGNKENEMRLDL